MFNLQDGTTPLEIGAMASKSVVTSDGVNHVLK